MKGVEKQFRRFVPSLIRKLKVPQWIPTARAASRLP